MPVLLPILQNFRMHPTSLPRIAATTKRSPVSGCLPFRFWLRFFCAPSKAACRHKLYDLFSTLSGQLLRTVSKSAVSQAR
ncbi:MAG: hypothetical protein ACRER2_11395, partial [Methylococcales bacterium]